MLRRNNSEPNEIKKLSKIENIDNYIFSDSDPEYIDPLAAEKQIITEKELTLFNDVESLKFREAQLKEREKDLNKNIKILRKYKKTVLVREERLDELSKNITALNDQRKKSFLTIGNDRRLIRALSALDKCDQAIEHLKITNNLKANFIEHKKQFNKLEKISSETKFLDQQLIILEESFSKDKDKVLSGLLEAKNEITEIFFPLDEVAGAEWDFSLKFSQYKFKWLVHSFSVLNEDADAVNQVKKLSAEINEILAKIRDDYDSRMNVSAAALVKNSFLNNSVNNDNNDLTKVEKNSNKLSFN